MPPRALYIEASCAICHRQTTKLPQSAFALCKGCRQDLLEDDDDTQGYSVDDDMESDDDSVDLKEWDEKASDALEEKDDDDLPVNRVEDTRNGEVFVLESLGPTSVKLIDRRSCVPPTVKK